MSNSYSKENITSLDILNHIKLRPTAYIPDTDVQGQYGVIKEILDNSLDEALELDSKVIIDFDIIYDSSLSRYLVSIRDSGRGIPHEKLIEVFTEPFTSGKFNTKAYQVSSGLYGLGSKVPVALSVSFRAITIRDGKISVLEADNLKDTTNITHHQPIPYLTQSVSNPPYERGTIVQFIIDDNLFNTKDFLLEGYRDFKILLSKISLFKSSSKFDINFRMIKVSKRNFTNSIARLTSMEYGHIVLDNFLSHERIPIKIIDSFYSYEVKKSNFRNYCILNLIDPTSVPSKYQVDNLDSIRELEIEALPKDSKIKLLELEIYNVSSKRSNLYSKYRTKKIGIINNLILESQSDYHFSELIRILKENISKLIPNKTIKEFFLSSQYRFPFIYLLNIKFSGATFVGTTKHAFRDKEFKKPYRRLLSKYIDSKTVKSIYQSIENDIESEYKKLVNKSVSIKNNKKLLLELHRPTKFCDCMDNDNSTTELFLMEGDSAKSVVGRNEKIQALYTLGGKPCNILLEAGKENLSIDRMMKNKILNDIVKILNIKPNDKTLDGLRYNKIFVMSDADTHGYHIASIIMSNLMLYNKYLIEKGHLYLVIPPLYSIKFKHNKESIYVRSEQELVYVLTKFIYHEVFNLYVKNNSDFINLPFDSMVVFLSKIFEISEMIEDMADTFNIPPLLLEQIIKSLIVSNFNINTFISTMKENFEESQYHERDKTFIFSIGLKDYIVPLTKLETKLADTLIPNFVSNGYDQIELFVEMLNKKDGNQTKLIPITIVQLKELCDGFSKLYSIERYKGIGSMIPEDRKKSCMDPNTRTIFQIRSIGKLETIYGMLGSNSSYRKNKLMEQYNEVTI